jgi:serralysin
VVEVAVSDGKANVKQAVTVTVSDADEAPSAVAPASVQVAENATAVTTVSGVDPEGRPLAFAIAGGADAALFTIDAATGALSFKAAPDFEAHRTRGPTTSTTWRCRSPTASTPS